MGGVVARKGGTGLLQRKQSEKQQNKFPIRFEVETIRAVDHVLFSSCFFFFFFLVVFVWLMQCVAENPQLQHQQQQQDSA